MTVDGGGSSSMAIGEGADGIAPGLLLGSGRPVASFFGIMAPQATGTASPYHNEFGAGQCGRSISPPFMAPR
jgi:hypothetical protein